MLKSIFLPILAVMVFIILVGFLMQGKFNKFITPQAKPTENTKVLKIKDVEINVEIAKTTEERAKGLGDRDGLDQNSGMLFVFENESTPTFWMKDTKFALDIIWINDNKIIGIDKNIQPENVTDDIKLTRYPSPSKVNSVLEVNSGFSDKNNLKVGDSVDLIE